jgi:hypothetical protein
VGPWADSGAHRWAEGSARSDRQYVPGIEIPERSWIVRLAKWLVFNDFGAYGKHFKADQWIDPQQVTQPPTKVAADQEKKLYDIQMPT